jgi:hypothetical protein
VKRTLYCGRCERPVAITGWKRVGTGGIVGAERQYAEVVVMRHSCNWFSVVLVKKEVA